MGVFGTRLLVNDQAKKSGAVKGEDARQLRTRKMSHFSLYLALNMPPRKGEEPRTKKKPSKDRKDPRQVEPPRFPSVLAKRDQRLRQRIPLVQDCFTTIWTYHQTMSTTLRKSTQTCDGILVAHSTMIWNRSRRSNRRKWKTDFSVEDRLRL